MALRLIESTNKSDGLNKEFKNLETIILQKKKQICRKLCILCGSQGLYTFSQVKFKQS